MEVISIPWLAILACFGGSVVGIFGAGIFWWQQNRIELVQAKRVKALVSLGQTRLAASQEDFFEDAESDWDEKMSKELEQMDEERYQTLLGEYPRNITILAAGIPSHEVTHGSPQAYFNTSRNIVGAINAYYGCSQNQLSVPLLGLDDAWPLASKKSGGLDLEFL